MGLTVGPIQSYVPGSTWFDLTQYGDFGIQEQVSIQLASSNLWLVNDSQLNFNQTATALVDLSGGGRADQASGQLSASGVTISDVLPLPGAVSSAATTLDYQLTASTGTSVQLTGSQSTTTSGSPQLATPGQGYGTSITIVNYPNDLSTPVNPGTPFFFSAYPDPSAPTPITPNPVTVPEIPVPIPGQPTIPEPIPGIDVPKPDPIPVPLDLHSTVGLLLAVGIFSSRMKVIRKIYVRLYQRKRDRAHLTSILRIEN